MGERKFWLSHKYAHVNPSRKALYPRVARNTVLETLCWSDDGGSLEGEPHKGLHVNRNFDPIWMIIKDHMAIDSDKPPNSHTHTHKWMRF
jgi:hypothetical protein